MPKFCDPMNKYVHLFSSESEHTVWTADDAYHRDKWMGEDEHAGPSQPVSPSVRGTTAPVLLKGLKQAGSELLSTKLF